MVHARLKLTNHGLNRALLLFAIAAAILYGLRYIHTTQVAFPVEFMRIISGIGVLIMTMLIATIFLRLTASHVTRIVARHMPIEEQLLVRKFYVAIMYVIAILVLLWYLGASLENLTLLLGLATTGLAFALREVLLSYLVWFMLLTKKPFRIGDYIRIGEDEGVVQHIGTFYVWIDDTPERKEDYVRIPNKWFLEKPLINLGRDTIRLIVRAPLQYIPKNTPSLFKKLDHVLKDIEHEPAVLETQEQHVFLTIHAFTTTQERKEIRTRILENIYQFFPYKKP